MRRSAAITLLLLGGLAGRGVPADASSAREDLWWVKPAIQIGGHAETGGGVLPGSGFDPREQGGGVAMALSLMAPARPRLLAGLAGELTAARAVLDPQTVIGEQTYGVASVRAMARAEFWSRTPFDRAGHGAGFYALLGVGWNFNSVGTRITYVAGAPAGTAGDLHANNRPGFELGGGTELVRKRDATLFLETRWVYNSGPYRLEVFGEPDRRGTFNLSGVTILLGLRFNPPAPAMGD